MRGRSRQLTLRDVVAFTGAQYTRLLAVSPQIFKEHLSRSEVLARLRPAPEARSRTQVLRNALLRQSILFEFLIRLSVYRYDMTDCLVQPRRKAHIS